MQKLRHAWVRCWRLKWFLPGDERIYENEGGPTCSPILTPDLTFVFGIHSAHMPSSIMIKFVPVLCFFSITNYMAKCALSTFQPMSDIMCISIYHLCQTKKKSSFIKNLILSQKTRPFQANVTVIDSHPDNETNITNRNYVNVLRAPFILGHFLLSTFSL